MATNCIFKSNLDEVFKALGEKAETAMEECGMDAEYYAKRLCPVDTGRLRNSITHATNGNSGRTDYRDRNGNLYTGGSAKGDVDDYTVVIGTNVEYAQFVEHGTHSRAAKPFLKPAIADHKSHYVAVIQKYLED